MSEVDTRGAGGRFTHSWVRLNWHKHILLWSGCVEGEIFLR